MFILKDATITSYFRKNLNIDCFNGLMTKVFLRSVKFEEHSHLYVMTQS